MSQFRKNATPAAHARSRSEPSLVSRFHRLGKAVPGWTALAVLTTAVVAVYGRALDAPFILDDADSVLTNQSIVRLCPPVGDAEQPGPLNPPSFSATSGRPLVNLTLALNYHFGQLDPTGYHVVNVAVHVLCALLVWAIVRRTLRLPSFGGRFDRASGPLSLAVALLWALHPLVTEAVIYVTQRTELIMALCYLATLYCSLRYWVGTSHTSRSAWLTLAVFACAAGMASKEVMVSAPLVVLLFERTLITDSFRHALSRSWPLHVGLSCGWLVLLYLQYGGPRSDTAGFHLGVPLFAWWFNQAKILIMYLKLAVWPWPLMIHYELPHLASPGELWPYAAAVAVLVVAMLVLLWRRHPAGVVAACVFAILAPTHVVPITTEVAAERRMYLPLAALVALAVVGSYSLLQQAARGTPRETHLPSSGRSLLATIVAVSLVLAVVYSIASARRLAAYRDPLVLWQQTVAHQPYNHIAQQNLAVALAAVGRSQEAIDCYRQALRSKPDMLEARYNLGLALAAAGQFDEAIEHLQAAVRLKPDAYKIRNNLGVVLFIAGRFHEAADEFRKALERKPDMVEAQQGLTRALEKAGEAPPQPQTLSE